MGRDEPWERRTLDDQGSILLGGGAAKRRHGREPRSVLRPIAFLAGTTAIAIFVVVDGSHHGRHLFLSGKPRASSGAD